MSSKKPITIIGGGLAGLTLGVGLRQQDVPVALFEAGSYPRHRVCGEFISGRGLHALERLGLKDKLVAAGARHAATAAFFSGRMTTQVKPLPEPALCFSRFQMDALLAAEFRGLGGELTENHRYKQTDRREGQVRASGRRRQPVEQGWRLFGLKVHARNVSMEADLEMHLTRDGYVGLCRLSDEVVNVCGLFRSRTTQPDLVANWQTWLAGRPGSLLHERLAAAQFDEASLSSVAGISLRPQRALMQSEICVGDAVTMIPPVTGNGMSMAFESAELAIEPLLAYSEGRLSWPEARRQTGQRCDDAFARRLAHASRLQAVLFRPAIRWGLLTLVAHWPGAWRMLFHQTR
ncbi:MAG: FAD-dependent monooxygenase [Opitutaceae bacterium]|nr:FAD-dependent monooxygenase [Verrucomicrobiales bacterium]